MAESTASTILSVAYVTFIAFSIPSRFIATGVGRRRTIIAGLATFAALQVVAFFTPTAPVVVGLLAVGGVVWSLVNVNSLPMVVDTSPSEASLGSCTGLYYVAGWKCPATNGTKPPEVDIPRLLGYHSMLAGDY